ncbi:MAG: hypothetical protein AAB869_01095 [Patescibacteria group bacterium]
MCNSQNTPVLVAEPKSQKNETTPVRVGGHPEWPHQETRVVTTAGQFSYREALDWDHK